VVVFSIAEFESWLEDHPDIRVSDR
jgi:hypothetical protein